MTRLLIEHLDSLEQSQRGLSAGVRALEARLVEARMQRGAPARIGSTGSRLPPGSSGGGRRCKGKRRNQTAIPDVPPMPSGLEGALRKSLEASSGMGVLVSGPRPPALGETPIAGLELPERLSMELIGRFDPAGSGTGVDGPPPSTGESELRFYRLSEAMDLSEVRSLAAARIERGRPFRIRPWTAHTREQLLRGRLVQSGERVPSVSVIDDGDGGRLLAGQVVVVEVYQPRHSDVSFDPGRLESKYKHAGDFGIAERFGESGLAVFHAALLEHVLEAEQVHVIPHRGAPTRAYLCRGRIVLVALDGRFLTGYLGSARQLDYVRSQPAWRR